MPLSMTPYSAKFARGELVQIGSFELLEAYKRTWRYHDPLKDDQLEHAGRVVRVRKAGFYHGGDPLYELEDVPGIWHEACLGPAP